MAVVFRFLVGFTNGVVGNVKAVVSEVSDDSNQAFGLSLVGASFGLGIIVGPAVSGAISDPIGQYNLNVENDAVRNFLTLFPYSPACIVNLAICLLAAATYYCLVPETLGRKMKFEQNNTPEETTLKEKSATELDSLMSSETGTDDSESEELFSKHRSTSGLPQANTTLYYNNGSNNNSYLKSVPNTSPTNSPTNTELSQWKSENNSMVIQNGLSLISPDTPLVSDGLNKAIGSDTVSAGDDSQMHSSCDGSGYDEGAADNGHRTGVLNSTARKNDENGAVPGCTCGKLFRASLKSHVRILFRDKSVFLSVLVYCIFSCVLIGWNEVFSVWAKTSPHLGGLGFNLKEIGMALTIAGAFYLPFSIFLYPLLERSFGSIKLFYGAFYILIPSIMLLPNVHYLIAWRELLWFCLCLLLFLNQTCIGVAISCSVLFVNNSVTFDNLGAVNGLTISLTSFGRALSPLVIGGLFSLSLSATQSGFFYPLDYRLVYLLFGSILFLCVLLVACLPHSINKQKKVFEDSEKDYE